MPKQSKDNGFIYRFNAQWKPQKDLMFYATWSKGFRPGGINRQRGASRLTIPISWPITSWAGRRPFGPLRWNGAIYHQIWKKFQFSFLGENSLTVIQNGRDARINGIETDINYVSGGLSLNAAAAYTDAKTKRNICDFCGYGNPGLRWSRYPGDPDFIVRRRVRACRSLRSSR